MEHKHVLMKQVEGCDQSTETEVTVVPCNLDICEQSFAFNLVVAPVQLKRPVEVIEQ